MSHKLQGKEFKVRVGIIAFIVVAGGLTLLGSPVLLAIICGGIAAPVVAALAS